MTRATQFIPGDVVRVREDLSPGMVYGDLSFAHGMKKYKGAIATVVSARRLSADYENIAESRYMLDIDNGAWAWNDLMLDPVVEVQMDEADLLEEL